MDEQKINQAVEVLRRSGVVIYPTDTLYGLGADATYDVAVNKVFKIKGRKTEQLLSWIFVDIEMVKQYTIVSNKNEAILKKYLPGKYTFILLSKFPGKTIGVRIPDYPIARELSKRLGKPITATSANRSGKPPINNLDGLNSLGADNILWVGSLPLSKPSTVVDLTGSKPKVIRKGAAIFSE